MIHAVTQSIIGMWYRCPQQVERRYFRGEIIPPGIAARRGSAVHKAAQINHQQKMVSHEDMPVDALQDAARDHYVKIVKEEGVFIPKDEIGATQKLLGDGLDAAVRLTKLYRESLAPTITPILVEEKLSLTMPELSLPVEGIVDVLDEAFWLPDFKTADKSKRQEDADNSFQLTIYAALVNRKVGRWPSKISLEVLVNNKEPKHQHLETKRGPADFAALIPRIDIMLAQMNAGLFPPCDPGAWICTPKWCGYFLTCKYAKRS